ncbi:MAG: xanthine dehydrogenase family protein subunit M [Herpetosiphonaceae bacterium]|nr:xanthine dehydrogenase family protein subunit M [Herpetosiphonaceae bacterium]
MFPNDFEYVAPATINEAVALLQANPDAKVLAGGHSLLPAMKLHLSTPSMLVDIGKIPELKGIHVNGGVSIGAYTTYRELETSQEVVQRLPILADCASKVGDPQVRNCGTIGGSVAHADPAADMPAVVLALNATMKAIGPQGERSIAVDDFFVEMLQSALAPDELLTEINIPPMPARMGSAYEKFKHPASGYAIVGVAVMVHLATDGKVSDCRIAVTGAGPKAQRAHAVEDALKGGSEVDAAAQKAGDGLEYLSDMSASEEYRAQLTRVLTRRALHKAMEQAR